MTEGESYTVWGALNTFYTYGGYGPGGSSECDAILARANERLQNGFVSYWTNAPSNYWGDNHSAYGTIHLTQWTWGNDRETAKTLFHEAAHQYFGASMREATILYFQDECLSTY